jgi:hypothetical protein
MAVFSPRCVISRKFWPILGALASLLAIHHIWTSGFCQRAVSPYPERKKQYDSTRKDRLACEYLPGANETLVVLRTGSTELEAKLSVHLNTTLRCYPNRLIFSDSECTYEKENIIDALETVSTKVKEDHPDFSLYRRLRSHGRDALTADETHGTSGGKLEESWTGHQENSGWKLDKWKFLPMVNRTLHDFPSMKWYVFVEADTYILWSSLLQYLATLDHRVPYYSGVRVFINDIGFAHGGSGFIVSQSAMNRVVDHYTKNQLEFENFTDNHWAGDCVLGKAFSEAGVKLTDAWPIIQGDHPGIVPYFGPDGRPAPPVDKRIWCSATVSYHHVQPDVIRDLWRFEQEQLHPQFRPLQHREFFEEYVLERMNDSRHDWDNESSKSVGIAADFDTCRTWCERDTQCLQFSLNVDGQCKHFDLPRLGGFVEGVRSGWMHGRIRHRMAALPSCD